MIKLRTRLCELLGIEYPIIEGGLDAKEGAACTAAISNAGGLGCVRESGYIRLGEDIKGIMIKELHQAKSLTDKPFTVNIRIGRAYEEGSEMLDLVLRERKKDPELQKKLVAVETTGGDCSPYVDKIKSAGLIHIHKISTLRHAQKAEAAGVDAVIVMSGGAGGNISGELLDGMVAFPWIAEAVKIPVIASGGMYDGKTLVAALALGAEGIEMGTRMMASQESEFPLHLKETILRLSCDDTTVMLGFFSPMRVYRNKWASQWMAKGISDEMIRANPKLIGELSRDFHQAARAAQQEGANLEELPWTVGQVAGRIKEIISVKDIIQNTISEARDIIHQLNNKLQEA